jgi:hypothetical protein
MRSRRIERDNATSFLLLLRRPLNRLLRRQRRLQTLRRRRHPLRLRPGRNSRRLPGLRRAFGRTSEARIVTAVTMRARFGPIGQRAACRCCGSSRSVRATPRSWSPTVEHSRSNNDVGRRSWPRTTSKRDASSGRTVGRRASRKRWEGMDHERRRHITTAVFLRSELKGSCAASMPGPARSSGAATFLPTTAPPTSNGVCPLHR